MAGSIADLEPWHTQSADLHHADHRHSYTLIYLPSMTSTALWRMVHSAGADRPPLVLGGWVSERTAAAFRKAQVQYLDGAGNAHLAFGPVRIDVRGRRRPSGDWVDAEASGVGINLFSPKRSRVIFALLTWPELLHQPIRDLAQAAGVSVGQAQGTSRLLQESGYALEKGGSRRLRKEDELTARWLMAYPTGLGPSLRMRDFVGDVRVKWPIDSATFVSGEAAVPELLRPSTLTLYVEQLDSRLVAAGRWRSGSEPNVFLRRKFWAPPAPEQRPERVRGIPVAPSLLVRADLRASGDARQRDAERTLGGLR